LTFSIHLAVIEKPKSVALDYKLVLFSVDLCSKRCVWARVKLMQPYHIVSLSCSIEEVEHGYCVGGRDVEPARMKRGLPHADKTQHCRILTAFYTATERDSGHNTERFVLR